MLFEGFVFVCTSSRISQIFPKTDELRRDFDELYKRLTQLNSPTVFCHNDLLLGNVIYSADRDQVTFIDYEYAAYNHQAFDIGNHFTEFAGLIYLIFISRLNQH